jgi:hypothetical protein
MAIDGKATRYAKSPEWSDQFAFIDRWSVGTTDTGPV